MATVLVVDDRAIDREFLATLLRCAGYSVLEANDGTDALRLVRSNHPDLVISDALTPSMDGVEFANNVRADPTIAATKIIFYTATYRLPEAKTLGRMCGVETIVPKPSEPQAILNAVAAALGTPAPVLQPGDGAGARSESFAEKLPSYLNRLTELQSQLRQAVTGGTELLECADAEHDAKRLLESFGIVQSLSLRLAAVLELELLVSSERDPQALLDLFGRGTQNIMHCRYVAIGLADADAEQLEHWAAQGFDAGPKEAFALLTPYSGALGGVLKSGRSCIRFDPSDLREVLGLPAWHPPIRSFLAVPLRIANTSSGWLYFADKAEGAPFNDEDEQLAWTLAGRLSVAYGQLRLYDEVQRHAARLQIEVAKRKERERRIARLSRVYAVLSEVNSAIVRLRDRQEMFSEVCRIAVTAGEFDMAWIGTIDPVTLEGQIVAWHGRDEEGVGDGRDEDDENYIRSVRFNARPTVPNAPSAPESAHPASRAAREMKSIIYNDLRADPLLAALHPERSERAARNRRSVAVFPIISNGHTAAVFTLYANEIGFFDEQELQLLRELAGDIEFSLDYAEKEAKLNYLAYYDGITGLPNGTLFRDRLRQLADSTAGAGRSAALFLIDLDRFTHMNDTLGRHAGDALLQMVAERIGQALPKPSNLARISADTFAVAVTPVNGDAGEAAAVARDRILAPLAHGFVVDGTELHVSAHIGIAMFPGDGGDAETLFKNAEVALKQAKASNDRYLFYAPDMNARAAERIALEAQIRKALQANQFVLHYQPRVDLASGQIVGAEALLRWQHPDKGLLSPTHFLAVAEDSDVAIPIGEWVLQAACEQAQAWIDADLPPLTVSVNLSAHQFHDEALLLRVTKALRQSQLNPEFLELELTERIAMQDIEHCAAKLKALKALGIKLSMDDFGTGYSSLNCLKQFPFDHVKIDQSFVRGVTTHPDDAAIVRAVISVSRSLGLGLVAEGVETEEQLRWLQRERCEQLQGYFFHRPVPADEFEQILREGKSLPVAASDDPKRVKTLLIVDDDPQVVAALTRLLRADDYRLLTAGSGAEALDLMARHDVQVVLSDHDMPAMTGVEFLSRVRTMYPKTVRILLSGYVEMDALTDAVNRGAVYRFLIKPWNSDVLRTSVREAFNYYWLTLADLPEASGTPAKSKSGKPKRRPRAVMAST